jgi:hypothetical protein
VLGAAGHYFLAKPIRNSARVDAITARYSSKTCVPFDWVKAIKMTATQINKIVKNIEAYFI